MRMYPTPPIFVRLLTEENAYGLKQIQSIREIFPEFMGRTLSAAASHHRVSRQQACTRLESVIKIATQPSWTMRSLLYFL